MYDSLKKLIPKKIKLFFRMLYFFFQMHIKDYDLQVVEQYVYCKLQLFQNENIHKQLKIKFLRKFFYVPLTNRNVFILNRIENKEITEIKLIHEKFLKPSTYIDIGANIGYWTFARNQILNNNIKFYCFEPSSLNFTYLKKNLGKFENIEIVNCGLSNQHEKKKLSFPSWERKERINNTGLLSLYGDTDIHSENVELITLDSYFRNKDVTKNVYIKIDTEGHECKVLEGSNDFLSRNLIFNIQLELAFTIENAVNKKNIVNSIKFLKSIGFKPYIFIDSHSNFLDLGGTSNRATVIEGFNILQSDKSVRLKLLSENDLEEMIINNISTELYFKK